MEIINGELEDNGFVINSMEQIRKIFQYRVRIITPEKVIKEQTQPFLANNVDGND